MAPIARTGPESTAVLEASDHEAGAARTEKLTAAQQRRAAARTRDLTALLRDRPDLAGVHAPADFAVDAVRWCA